MGNFNWKTFGIVAGVIALLAISAVGIWFAYGAIMGSDGDDDAKPTTTATTTKTVTFAVVGGKPMRQRHGKQVEFANCKPVQLENPIMVKSEGPIEFWVVRHDLEGNIVSERQTSGLVTVDFLTLYGQALVSCDEGPALWPDFKPQWVEERWQPVSMGGTYRLPPRGKFKAESI